VKVYISFTNSHEIENICTEIFLNFLLYLKLIALHFTQSSLHFTANAFALIVLTNAFALIV